MRTKFSLFIFGGMIVFILLHLFLSQLGLFTNVSKSLMSIIGGLLPAIIFSDSLSTRNPALEDFASIISDLPGAYSFYLSPIFSTPHVGDIPIWSNFQGHFQERLIIGLIWVVIILLMIMIVVSISILRKNRSKV
ncbi:MAG: hypothetical protein ACTSW1_07175 [Candidatus Hodarchaeales archaeon]